ncbi:MULTISPECIES: hypothetical protein [unclassified Pseudomonas]|uniref:hypothetical protein n=1 Tax=unclassified Pseudomonas TaxID=196821 RepID=UPI00224ADF76|nr:MULTISPECIES: hypothetical protein [unclassified Pseudomonas]MCX2816007.1 hypothetical protein [Pseudomonas sp. DCB_E]MCX9144480.1 hypothetical protein [Pseudomonas sp. DCB_Q]
MDTTHIVSREQLLKANPAIKEKTLDYLLRNRRQNGLDESGAVLRLGREFIFDLDLFIAYVKSRKA